MVVRDSFKVSIVGCGKVGMTAAFSLMMRGEITELVLFGRNKDEVIGEQLDLEHGSPFLSSTKVLATDRYEDLQGSDVVVITAGAAQKPGETRLDLAVKNTKIIEEIIPQVVKNAPDCVILIVSNPVDILTYKAYQISGWPKGRIFGSGTTLDTARFRFHLSEMFKVNPRSIHAYIIGEHGDHSFPALTSASIGGQPLTTFPEYSPERARQAFQDTKTAAYKIIQSKGATFYAIGVVVSQIVSSILRDSKSVLPVSIPLHQYLDHSGVALSVPCVIGRAGVEKILQIKLNWDEKQQFDSCVATLKEYL